MKIKTISMVAFSVLALNSAAALAQVVNGGTVKFEGEVVNAACAVDAGSSNQTVQLGQVRSARLATSGSTSSAVGFNIQLNDCDSTVADQASVAFSGTTVNANANVLALQSSAAGVANNVGVQILDRTGTPLALNGASFSAPTTLNNGTNVLPFQARYYATGAATAGTANAEATFSVQYN